MSIKVVPTAPVDEFSDEAQALSARFKALIADVEASLIERESFAYCAAVALVAGANLVQLGPPGTAKSYGTKELVRRIVAGGSGPLRYFQAAGHPLQKPEELFGGPNFKLLKDTGTFRYNTAGMLPEAHIVFYDECFKAGGSLQKTLLSILNEREFKNGDLLLSCPLINLFGASNELPQGDDLQANWDRFEFRLPAPRLSESGKAQLIREFAIRQLGQRAAPAATISLDEIAQAQALRDQIPFPGEVEAALGKLWAACTEKGIDVSERRMMRVMVILQACAVVEGRTEASVEDFPLLEHVLWHEPSQRQIVSTLCMENISPLAGLAKAQMDEALSTYTNFKAKYPTLTGAAASEKVLEAHGALKANGIALKNLRGQCAEGTASAAIVDRALAQVRAQFNEVASVMGTL